ncbi:MAG: phosphoribosylformylglycinamidine cyclo-ligase, partial [Oscillospiraceae bacterium]
LDYIAVGKNVPTRVAEIVSGVAEGCVQAGCALIGGETAEMPGFYPVDEYDLAGFCVGMADKKKLVDPQNLKEGDAIIAVASSGVHSNGFSLVRKVFNITQNRLKVYSDELGQTIGEELLTPTRIYVKPLIELMSKIDVHAISHITGGGFYENIPRMLKENTRAVIDKSKVDIKPIFRIIQNEGICEHDMFNTFNMGVGLCIAVASDKADEAVRILNSCGEKANIIGEIKAGEQGVDIC